MNTESETSIAKDQPKIHPLVLAEYGALREEILKRVELRSQVISLTLIILGSILGFGLQVKSSSVIFLYPIIATFLAANWVHNGKGIRDASIYIIKQIEDKVGKDIVAWEHRARNRPRMKLLDNLNFVSANGVFIGTSLVAIVVALSLITFEVVNFLLLFFAITSLIGTVYIIHHPSNKYWLPPTNSSNVSSDARQQE